MTLQLSDLIGLDLLSAVYGINSLKTLQPPLASLSGESVETVDTSTDERLVRIGLSTCVLTIDLARTGSVRRGTKSRGWALGEKPAPTLRFLFTNGLSLDFIEPARQS